MTKVFKASNKNGQRIVHSYFNGDNYDNLYQAYRSPSQAKIRAYEWCYNRYRNEIFSELAYSNSFKVCSHNTHGFSVGWLGNHDSKGKYLEYHTPTNDYVVWLEE